eukprot:4756209-Amphidinium_carterae.1
MSITSKIRHQLGPRPPQSVPEAGTVRPGGLHSQVSKVPRISRTVPTPVSQPASQPACLPTCLPACPLASPSMGRQCPRGRGATRVAALNIQTFINYESTERANFH